MAAAGAASARAPPVGPLPAAKVTTVKTTRGQLVSIALPTRRGYDWRIARRIDARVVRQIGEGDVGSQRRPRLHGGRQGGRATIVFAETRGETAKAYRRGTGTTSPVTSDRDDRPLRLAPDRLACRMRVLAVDVGGRHVKALVQGETERRRFKSGPRPDSRADGRGNARARRRLGLRPRLGRRAGAGRRRRRAPRPGQSRPGLGGLRLRGRVRAADEGRERRGRCRRSAATRADGCSTSGSAPGSARR